MSTDTPERILKAAREKLLAEGYAALSTRSVADTADVPLSQIHYHFGSKEELILSLLRSENDRILERQTAMYAREIPLWKRWDQACSYFDDDIDSGYVRVLMEMTAAGWSSEAIRNEVKAIYREWVSLLTKVVEEAAGRGLALGGMRPVDISALVSAAFIGSEALILSDMESDQAPFRQALRRMTEVIREAEKATA